MENVIASVQRNLRMDRYRNEAEVRQGIVLPILAHLNWPLDDTEVVAPEFQLGTDRVDLALCSPVGKPIVFVEIKRLGTSLDAERQLFGYAVHYGVPLLVLTNGQMWQFYLPGEEGNYDDRRVHSLDLAQDSVHECVERLGRYLDFHSVTARRTFKAARDDLASIVSRRNAQAAVPLAWKQLVKESDELLVELIAERAEAISGHRPEFESIVAFLATLLSEQRPRTSPDVKFTMMRPRTGPITQPGATRRISPSFEELGFILHEQRYPARSGRDVLVQVFQHLYRSDPTFPERFAARRGGKNKRPFLAQSREELYPRNPDLATNQSYSQQLTPGSGWWVDVNVSRPTIKRLLQLACSVAGLQYGKDLVAFLRTGGSTSERLPSRSSLRDNQANRLTKRPDRS